MVSPGEPRVELVPQVSRRTSKDYPFEIGSFTYGFRMSSICVVRLWCPN